MGVIENVPRETFLSVNIFFLKNITYRTSFRLVHEKWPVHSADEVKASKKAYSSFPEKNGNKCLGGRHGVLGGTCHVFVPHVASNVG